MTPTERLFHIDAYQREFEARVLECRAVDGGFEAVLDRTAFYATSGGQPHDTGTLGGARVREVRDDNDVLRHRLDRAISGDVTGAIDWPRRLDHMQQHTGQHVLSQSFIETADAETISFHLGEEKATIDLSRGDLSEADMARAEARANEIVAENREVLSHWTTRADLDRFPLRKPPAVDGAIRIIEVKDFDYSACGGTHVTSTAGIRLIKVLRRENYKGGLRIEFLCGDRAIRDYAWKHELVRSIAERFSTLDRDLGRSIEKLEEEARSMRRRLKEFEDERLERDAKSLAAAAVPHGDHRLVRSVRSIESRADLKNLALRLRAHRGLVVLLGAGDASGRAHLVFARSDDVDADMSAALKVALPAVDGRGGGRPEMAQGSGPRLDAMEQALDAAAGLLSGPAG